MTSEQLRQKAADAARRRPIWLLAAALLIGLTVWAVVPRQKAQAAESFYNVRRSDFLISIREGGTLEARNEVEVRSDVEGTARIIFIVPEGTYVKEGQLLVELDSSAAQDQVNQQLINYEKARYAAVQAKEQLEIQKSIVDSDVRTADLKLEFAKKDLQKYLEGESLQLKRNLEIDITNVRESLALAEERLQWSEKLQSQGFETKSNLDKDRLAVNQFKLKHEQALKELELFELFDYPKQKRQLESNVEEAGNELARVKLQGERRLSQYQADLQTQESTLVLSQKKLERDEANLKACKILAPQDGLVVYAMSNNRFSNESLIEEGATVRNRQELIKLPDVTEMKLVVKIHESHVTMVQPGQQAFVVLDSLPDQRFRGVVRKVALLPDASSRWGNPNLKLYPTEILLTDELPNVKPGVSARAEIVITNLQNAITLPLQAVTTRQGQQVAYVDRDGKAVSVPLELGLYNTTMIQVLNGVKEGDRVLLAPPLDTQQQDFGGAILTQNDTASLTNAPAPEIPAGIPPRAGDSEPARQLAGGPEATAEGAPKNAPRPSREEMMKQFDTNSDGELDETERTAMRARFQGMGGNRQRGGEAGAEGGERRGRRPEGAAEGKASSPRGESATAETPRGERGEGRGRGGRDSGE